MNGLYDELRIALFGIWNRRWLALAVAWAICLLGWLVIAIIPNSYESHARIYVQMQDILSDRVGISPISGRKQLERLQDTLLSNENLEKVVRGTELGALVVTENEMGDKIAMLRKALVLRAEKDNLFEIRATLGAGGASDAATARLSKAVVQKLVEVFEEDNIATGRRETSQTLRFLDQKLAELQPQLQVAEGKRVRFETENMGLLPGAGSVSQQMEGARAELQQIESQLVSAQSALSALSAQLAGTPPTIAMAGGGAAGGPAGLLAAARAELSAARARGWTEDHPDVVAMKNQIAALTAQARAAPAGNYGTPNPAYASLSAMKAERQASVMALQSRKAALQSELAQFAAKATSEPGVAAELTRIGQDYDVLKNQYDKLLAEREAIRLRGEVASETDAVQFKVIEQPDVPRAPAAPNRPLLLLAVLVAGIGGGGAAAFALAHLQTTFPTAGKLERASGLVVIGSVSQMLTSAQQAARARRQRLFYGGSGALLALFLLLQVIELIQRGSVA